MVSARLSQSLEQGLGSRLRLRTARDSRTTKVTAKAALSRGMGKKHGWELDKRNREHTSTQDTWHGQTLEVEKSSRWTRCWSKARSEAGARLKQEETRLQTYRKSCSDCLHLCPGEDKPGAAGGCEVYWAFSSMRVKGGRAGSHWTQGLSGANTAREKKKDSTIPLKAYLKI